MKKNSYTQIYKNKNHEKNKQSFDTSLNQSKKSHKKSINTDNSNNSNIINNPFHTLTEKNASIITFSNFDNNQDLSYRLSQNSALTEENATNQNKKLLNKINISDQKRNPIIKIGKEDIQYNTLNLSHNSFNSLEEIDDLVNIKKEEGKEKLIKKMNEKDKKIVKQKKEELFNKKEIKKLNVNNNKNINSSTFKNSKEKNNLKVTKNKLNNSRDNKKNNSKNKNGQINKNKNNNKTNNIKNYLNSNYDEISIRSEGSNTVIYESKFSKNNKNIQENKVNIASETNERQLTNEEILYCTHIIFLNNASFIKNKNKYMMPKNNFLNIMKSLNLISNQLILVEIDLIFDSFSPQLKMITYSQFNQILMKIIQKLYPEKYKISPKIAKNFFLNKLINEYNLFFENKIPKDYLYKYQYNSIVKILEIMPNQNQIFIMNDIYLTINEIYSKYFRFEMNYNPKNIYKSSENLFEFCKDFEIFPQTINQTQAMTYYNLSIHINEGYNLFNNEITKYKNFKNKGIIFTLIHFMLFFIHISLYSYTKLFGSKKWTYDVNKKAIPNEAKLIIFLEKLEHSKGMINFVKQLSWPTIKSFSLIPDKEICTEIGIFDIYNKKGKGKGKEFLI